MMNEYLTTSFMSANEGFNSNMVFETQPESINLEIEERKYLEVYNRKFNPVGVKPNPEELSSSPVLEEKLSQVTEPTDEELPFELDRVNSHQCMKNIRRCIQKMAQLFQKDWSDMP